MAHSPDAAKLLLRLTLGILILLHGINKLVHGLSGTVDLVASHGLPGALGYGVLIGEVLAPLLVIAGYHARVGAALVAANMLFALGLVHSGELFSLNNHGGWAIELQAFYLVTAIAIIQLGSGRYAIRRD